MNETLQSAADSARLLELVDVLERRSRTTESLLNIAIELQQVTEERSRSSESLLNSLLELQAVTEERSRTLLFESQQIRHALTYQQESLHAWYLESLQARPPVSARAALQFGRQLRLETDHPIASHSNDHIQPDSTAEGISRPAAFVRHCIDVLGRDIRCLDIGVGAAGLVFEFVMQGIAALGIDGSDHCRKEGIGYWPILPENLFTCDITKPYRFAVRETGAPVAFQLITCWEVMEHIAANDTKVVLSRIRSLLADGGYFVGSISRLRYDAPDGSPYHVTLESPDWWQHHFKEAGLLIVDDHPFDVSLFCRGNGPRFQDFHNYSRDPGAGFHFVARASS
ncbi:class I SAM-dependent methyltransferase [Uliginosibacterium sp. H1]|uniref:class I SAM-dependent methyltransferase n=1 Tax=Uliginosibacterium sp. H1 TaxID=3114757 RepID=UPI002E192F72|nr:methyltransferase domain-containing protein [Uliginosibacterium sp. H1]